MAKVPTPQTQAPRVEVAGLAGTTLGRGAIEFSTPPVQPPVQPPIQPPMHPRTPIQVPAERLIQTSAPATAPAPAGRRHMARVAVLIVTWNRKELVARALRAVAKQSYAADLLDVVVIDNASTDGTLEYLIEAFGPEHVVENPAVHAHEPRFGPARPGVGDGKGVAGAGGNALGFASMTIVRNTSNHGGCGGFNTGFAFVEQRLCEAAGRSRPEFLWLVDDDADLSPVALAHLSAAMATSADIGIVGSRTVDIRQREPEATIETTIYYNVKTGAMQDDAPLHHLRRAEFERWVKQTGGTRGERAFTGMLDVDVVSACSLLARWDAVIGPRRGSASTAGREPVGFWDSRYFIYCDDADWCLRFAKHGWRVVLSLDAVVYHTPWNLKLTPARIYYAGRNRIWMGQKALPRKRLRAVTRSSMWSILRDSLRASFHRRTFHAEIILSTARDVAIGRSGKTGSDGPVAEPVVSALRRASAGTLSPLIAVHCCHPESLKWFEELRARAEGGGLADVRWLPIVRNDVPGKLPEGSLVYGSRKRSRLKKQFKLFRAKPSVCVVFDQTNDFPILSPGSARFNVHIDQKAPDRAQVEPDGWGVRGRFAVRWMCESARCLWWASRVKPFVRTGVYG